jgi:hypothetical protein
MFTPGAFDSVPAELKGRRDLVRQNESPFE